MIITGKKVGTFAGCLAVLLAIFMLIGNVMFHKDFSYVAIVLGSISGSMLLLLLYSKQNVVKDKNKN